MKLIFLALLLCTSFFSMGQDVIVIDEFGKNLNHSIADQFTIYSSEKRIRPEDFKSEKVRKRLKKENLTQSVENLDFTTKYFYIWFNVKNKTNGFKTFYLETARPITNKVELFSLDFQSEWAALSFSF